MFKNREDVYTFYDEQLKYIFDKALEANNINLKSYFDLENRSVYVRDNNKQHDFRFEWSASLKLRKLNNELYTKDKGFIIPKVAE